MLIQASFDLVDTPAFVYDETEVDRVVGVAGQLRSETGCQVCYSIKPLSLPPLMRHMAPGLDGFAVSSPFEARLALSCLAQGGAIHFHQPRNPAGRNRGNCLPLRLCVLQQPQPVAEVCARTPGPSIPGPQG